MVDVGENVKGYTEVVHQYLENFPEILIENDYKTSWVHGGVYTFEAMLGYILNYDVAAVIYQELDVIRIYSNGKREVIGKTVYTTFIEDREFIRFVEGIESEGGQALLTDVLFYAVEQKIREFGNGIKVHGCEFVTNEEDVLLTEIDVLKEIVKRFRGNMENFFTDILVKEEFNRGVYRINIEGIEVGYDQTGGWGVLLMLVVQHYKTLGKRELELTYHTKVMETEKAPDLDTLRTYILKEVKRFVRNNPKSKHFGIEFRFADIKTVNRDGDVYRKIRGEKEAVDIWAERFVTVLGNHRGSVQEKARGLKTLDEFGIFMTLRNGEVLVFSEGGIMLSDGREVYIKKEMNLQDGLRNLVRILGKNRLTLDIMKTYDYRTSIKEESS